MAGTKKIDRLTTAEARLHKYISADLARENSLILSKLMDSFARLSIQTEDGIVDVKRILPFMKVHSNDVNKDNARKVLKQIILNKLSNLGGRHIKKQPVPKKDPDCVLVDDSDRDLKRSSDLDRVRSSFSMLEVSEFCSMLQITPESLFVGPNIAMLMPVQYCSIKQIKTWISEAKTMEPLGKAIRIPFQRAPVIDVGLDVYLSAGKMNTLDNFIAMCQSIDVGKPKTNSRTNQPIENYIQIQVFLTDRISTTDQLSRPRILPMFKAQAIEYYHLESLLCTAQRCYIDACIDRYDAEGEYIGALSRFSDGGGLAQYYTDSVATDFKRKLDYQLTKEQKRKCSTSKFLLDDQIAKAKDRKKKMWYY